MTVLGVGATIVQTGNLAPGNTLQNVSNLPRPTLLISSLVAIRRAQRSPGYRIGAPPFEVRRRERVCAGGLTTASVATGFGLGLGIGQPVIGVSPGIVGGAGLAAFVCAAHPVRGRSPKPIGEAFSGFRQRSHKNSSFGGCVGPLRFASLRGTNPVDRREQK